MVKSKEDYDRRMDDSRFKKFDKVIDPSYGERQYIILVIGIITVLLLLIAPVMFNLIIQPDIKTIDTPYEDGLNISYIPKDKVFSVSFTNPKSDTLSLTTLIQVPMDLQSATPTYVTVYDYTITNFPQSINYTPSVKISNINHIVTVTLVKNTGNYTYIYASVPQTEDKLWDGAGKYINGITNIFNKDENNK